MSPGRSNAIKEGNSGIVKLIVGEIFSLLGKEKEAAIVKQIEGSYWYKLIMIEDCSCSDYWHNEKEEINRQF